MHNYIILPPAHDWMSEHRRYATFPQLPICCSNFRPMQMAFIRLPIVHKIFPENDVPIFRFQSQLRNPFLSWFSLNSPLQLVHGPFDCLLDVIFNYSFCFWTALSFQLSIIFLHIETSTRVKMWHQNIFWVLIAKNRSYNKKNNQ